MVIWKLKSKILIVSSKLAIGEQNVVPSKSRVDESSNRCGLKLAMATFRNSNDDITPNRDWEF